MSWYYHFTILLLNFNKISSLLCLCQASTDFFVKNEYFLDISFKNFKKAKNLFPFGAFSREHFSFQNIPNRITRKSRKSMNYVHYRVLHRTLQVRLSLNFLAICKNIKLKIGIDDFQFLNYDIIKAKINDSTGLRNDFFYCNFNYAI